MKTLTNSLIALFACTGLALVTFAGPEPIRDYKDSKTVAPVPPPCNWQGFYMGLHIGGQFGNGGDTDLDGYNLVRGDHSSYNESGLVAGGQLGFNYQWRWLVVGLEGDLGYMNLDGSGIQPASVPRFHSDTIGKSDSDFYTTFRGRIGIAHNNWLFYGTGGVIGVNFETRVIDTNSTPPGSATIDADKQKIDWGWTVGGGIEYMINCRWSIKGEYLYYQLADQEFHALDNFGVDEHWRANADGHIVRAGVNFHF
jgi:outer membrane immunogenic protein